MTQSKSRLSERGRSRSGDRIGCCCRLGYLLRSNGGRDWYRVDSDGHGSGVRPVAGLPETQGDLGVLLHDHLEEHAGGRLVGQCEFQTRQQCRLLGDRGSNLLGFLLFITELVFLVISRFLLLFPLNDLNLDIILALPNLKGNLLSPLRNRNLDAASNGQSESAGNDDRVEQVVGLLAGDNDTNGSGCGVNRGFGQLENVLDLELVRKFREVKSLKSASDGDDFGRVQGRGDRSRRREDQAQVRGETRE